MAAPLTAAITGWCSRRRAMITSSRSSIDRRAMADRVSPPMLGITPASSRSAPEQKPDPAPVITTTRVSLSTLTSSSASRSGIMTSKAIAFIRSGRLRVMSVICGRGLSMSTKDMRMQLSTSATLAIAGTSSVESMAEDRAEVQGVEQGPHDAPLVVLVHGAPDRGRSFYAVARHLGDLRVLVYDRRGYGASLQVAPPATSLADHARDLIGLLAGRRATIVGHSFGGNVALLAAALEPSLVTSLGLWEPPLPWFDWWPAWARKVIADIAGHPDPGKVGERAFKVVAGR